MGEHLDTWWEEEPTGRVVVTWWTSKWAHGLGRGWLNGPELGSLHVTAGTKALTDMSLATKPAGGRRACHLRSLLI